MSAARLLVVADRTARRALPGVAFATPEDFFVGADTTLDEGAIVVNLCPGYHYLSRGYYVSLLAPARQQRVYPTLDSLEVLGNPFAWTRALHEVGVPTLEPEARAARRPGPVRIILPDTPPEPAGKGVPVAAPPPPAAPATAAASATGNAPAVGAASAVPATVAPEVRPALDIRILMGRTTDARLAQACKDIFKVFPAPILRVRFYLDGGIWKVGQLRVGALRHCDAADLALLREVLAAPERLAPRAASKPRPHRLAVLFDPTDPFAPSDDETIDKLAKIGQRKGFLVERIGKADIGRLAEYDALFIRIVTGLEAPAFAFAQRAQALGIPVIDTPHAILRCSNKVFLYELFRKNGVAMPRTMTLSRKGGAQTALELGLPLILKVPDGTFSNAVKKARDLDELETIARDMFKQSSLLIAQEYIPTAFDWRVCVLDGKVLFVAKYHMVKDHWQIAQRSAEGRLRFGRAEAVAVSDTPPAVALCALEAAVLVGDGLYGVDVKETPDGPVVIEVNDNPNLQCDVEDLAEGDRIYEELLAAFARRIAERDDGLKSE